MHFDVVIVGAGAAGAILAARLSEDPSRSVCLIEAGADYESVDALPPAVRGSGLSEFLTSPGENPNDPSLTGLPDWGYNATLTPLQQNTVLPRGMVIGGSSSVNGCVYFHPLRQDLDEWAKAGNPSWAFEQCLPAITRIETDLDFGDADYHGSSGPVLVRRPSEQDYAPLNAAFYDASLEAGFADCPDLNMPDSSGVGPTPANMHDGIRFSTAVAYLLPARARKNLTIMGNTRALRVKIRDGIARSVEVEHDGVVAEIGGDEIVLSAGAIGSPHILLQSGIGPADEIHKLGADPLIDLPGVGRNLRDHPVLSIRWSAPGVELPNSGPKRTAGQLRIRATTPGSDDTMDMMIMSFRRHGSDCFSVSFSLMRARSAGSVKLSSLDPVASPLIDLRHLDDPSDIERMSTMFDVVRDLVSRSPYEGLRHEMISPEPVELGDLKTWMLRTVFTGHHSSGTCKMGRPDDPTAVVDEFGMVYGVERLRVADASIMVDCPRVNINCPSMMIGERISEAISSGEH